MKPVKGYYSIVQYCPHLSRAEGANVGVVLFCPDMKRVEARMTPGNDRVRRFFGGELTADLAQINAAKDALISRLETERERFQTFEDLQKFIDTRANEIIITPARPTKVADFEADLRALFEELVGGRAARKAHPREADVPELDRELRSPRFHGRICFDQEVQVPLVNRVFRVPYQYTNGCVNLVKPNRFSSNGTYAVNSAMQLAVEGDLLQRHPAGNTKRRVIIVARHEDPGASHCKQIHDLLQEYRLRYVSTDALRAFIREVDMEAK